ncbi:MAG: DUF4349 domain-containing protein [Anaerolineales bacterium]|nr:DUF4349 domain-containing protein [Anaerolineales bacterium]
MKNRQAFAFILLITVGALLMSACAGSASYSEPAYDMAAEAPMEEVDFYYEEEMRANTAGAAPQISDATYVEGQAIQRIVLMNADLAIVVPDPVASMDTITAMAQEMGGFVVDSNLRQVQLDSGLEVPSGNVTVRVPAERLEEALDTIEAMATEVQSKNVSGQDVTREYTDLQSRLRNLENAEAQLTEILGNAQNTDDVLDVYNQLTYIREQIEVIKGQIRYYDEAAALSAVSVRLTADEAVQPLQIGGWQPAGVAKDAVEALVKTMRFFGDAAIWILIYLLPVLIILAIPVVVLVFVIRALVRRSKAKKAAKAEKAASETEA